MANYIYFTDEQKELARQTDLCDLLRRQGEKLKRSGSEYEWRDGSQKVTIRGNLWFHQYERTGGDAVDFVQRYFHKSFPEAVEYLLGSGCGTLTASPVVQRETPPFVPPKRNDNMRRVYAYLISRRGIDRDVVNAFAYRQMIYESAEYHNAVFVGLDRYNKPRYANLRGLGTDFVGDATGSDKRFSFSIPAPGSDTVHLFESAIDLLSYATLVKMNGGNWNREHLVSLAGVYKPKEELQESSMPLALKRFAQRYGRRPLPEYYGMNWDACWDCAPSFCSS